MLMENHRKITLALIYGGRGCEREVSIRGAEFILPLMDRTKYCVLPILIARNGRWLLGEDEVFPIRLSGVSGFLRNNEIIRTDVALPLLHGDFGEDGVVQGALENAGIPYVGCDVRAGAVASDKAVTKQVAESLGISTVPWTLALRSEGSNVSADCAVSRLGLPLFVKPAGLGSSVGAAQAYDRKSLVSALKSAFDLCDRVIVESLISPCREIEVAYYSAKGKEMFTYPGEIQCSSGFYDYDKKYLSGKVSLSEDANIDGETADRIKGYAAALVRAIGIRDISRLDFFLSGEKIYFNEINTMPGFTTDSLYHRLMKNAGVDIDSLLDGLIEAALGRA